MFVEHYHSHEKFFLKIIFQSKKFMAAKKAKKTVKKVAKKAAKKTVKKAAKKTAKRK